MSKIVVALGGNALGKTPSEQLELVNITAKSIVDIVKAGNEVIVTHGNGPQVGIINLAFDYASVNGGDVPSMPFAECGAMSQGYIGYHLQQAINNCLRINGIDKKCATIITQVEVDKEDAAFSNPTKPVGMFYTQEQADNIASLKGYKFVEDAGRGYRRVVPSPKPISILELDVIKQCVDNGNIVISVGGGGIPVIKNGCGYTGIDAVIDKDFALAKIASLVNADTLIILTAVDHVYVNYGKPDQKALVTTNLKELEQYIKENQFAPGSMLPKIQAAINFVSSGKNKSAIIADLTKVEDALEGKSGTKIVA